MDDQTPDEEQLSGKFMKAMSGTRDEAQNWQKKLSGSAGPRRGRHRHATTTTARGSCAASIVHGDDVVLSGRKEYLGQTSEYMATKFSVNVDIIGLGEPNILRVLNRTIK